MKFLLARVYALGSISDPDGDRSFEELLHICGPHLASLGIRRQRSDNKSEEQIKPRKRMIHPSTNKRLNLSNEVLRILQRTSPGEFSVFRFHSQPLLITCQWSMRFYFIFFVCRQWHTTREQVIEILTTHSRFHEFFTIMMLCDVRCSTGIWLKVGPRLRELAPPLGQTEPGGRIRAT